MRTFVSVVDVDMLLGESWATTEAKDRAVLMANVWLGNKGLPEIEPIPNAWKQAGAEIAKEAAAGKLYAATETGVLSKAVDADGVSVSKTYSATAQNLSAGEAFALALIKPWLTKRSGVMMLKRV
ncbi:hypothetical protein PAEH1_01470 [Paenalcaligenes hominis]|uniref:Protein singed n=1 Tax=Paenalcaligenes hominis TaxID=643674 RepID=A0A1U9JXP8_9BURK|nr:hypothetical protein [Paenalcaligenes hominis]AQS50548.1 hypothetical protein PAEH1_01470 [Paenalcaligenes hominis]